MSNAVFPATIRGLTYVVNRTHEFSTIVQTSPSRAETRIRQYRNPAWTWILTYEFLKDFDIQSGFLYTDLRTLVGFGLARSGQADDFLFTDPDDHVVTAQLLSVVNDGAGNYYSPIQRDFGGFLEDVTDLNGSITVLANGIATTNYTVSGPGFAFAGASFAGLYLKWLAAPATPVTATFQFYFRVRFADDQMGMDKWANRWWTAGGPDASDSTPIKLTTSRVTAF
jgi:hypothetical protein